MPTYYALRCTLTGLYMPKAPDLKQTEAHLEPPSVKPPRLFYTNRDAMNCRAAWLRGRHKEWDEYTGVTYERVAGREKYDLKVIKIEVNFP